MKPVLNITDLIIVSVICAAGILADTFIVAVNLLDWFKGGRLNNCDQILVCLGVSSACFHTTVVGLTSVFSLWAGQNVILPVLSQLSRWWGASTYWLAACLCLFYCVKIVDFNHRLFIWLKLRITKLMPWLLLGSLVGCLALSIPTYWNLQSNICPSKTGNMDNDTVPCSDLELDLGYSVSVPVLGYCLPLLVAMACITLILISLGRHTRRMKENMSEFSQPQLEAHHRAAKIVGFLLLIFCPLFLLECFRFMNSPPVWFVNVFWYIMVCFNLAQSIVVILGNNKLKQVLLNVLTLWRK